MNQFINIVTNKILIFYYQYILIPYHNIDNDIKKSLSLLLILLGGFATISLRPSLLNRAIGLK